MRTVPTLLALSTVMVSTTFAATPSRLRVVVSTDFPPIGVCLPNQGCPADHTSDPDDMQSVVRFLLYANEFDIEGLVVSSGTFAGIAKKQNMLDVLAVYDKVYANLKSHDPLYPTAAALAKVTYQGRSGTWGNTTANNIGAGKDSEASEAIIALLDKPDPRPVWFCFWGDCSNLAQAIWKVQNTRSAAELKAFLAKIRIHMIAHQDDTIDWLMNNFPDLFIIYSKTTYQGMFGGSDALSNTAWVTTNVIRNHGPLGAIYPPAGIGSTGVAEGDSPSFLHLVSANRGLNNPEDPTQPSWGGQFKLISGKHWGDGVGGSSISKWRKDFQAEFATRADWMVTPTTGVVVRPESETASWIWRHGSRLDLDFVAKETGNATLQMFDLSGRIAVTHKLALRTGERTTTSFDLNSLAKGIYTARLECQGKIVHQRIILATGTDNF